MDSTADNGSTPRARPFAKKKYSQGIEKRMRNLVPFKKGDGRKHGGRPRCFDEFRKLARAIAAGSVKINGEEIPVSEYILRTWVLSDEPQLQRAFVEYAFGKVPDRIEASELGNKTTLILHYGHEKQRRDLDHQRLSAGVSPSADQDR